MDHKGLGVWWLLIQSFEVISEKETREMSLNLRYIHAAKIQVSSTYLFQNRKGVLKVQRALCSISSITRLAIEPIYSCSMDLPVDNILELRIHRIQTQIK